MSDDKELRRLERTLKMKLDLAERVMQEVANRLFSAVADLTENQARGWAVQLRSLQQELVALNNRIPPQLLQSSELEGRLGDAMWDMLSQAQVLDDFIENAERRRVARPICVTPTEEADTFKGQYILHDEEIAPEYYIHKQIQRLQDSNRRQDTYLKVTRNWWGVSPDMVISNWDVVGPQIRSDIASLRTRIKVLEENIELSRHLLKENEKRTSEAHKQEYVDLLNIQVPYAERMLEECRGLINRLQHLERRTLNLHAHHGISVPGTSASEPGTSAERAHTPPPEEQAGPPPLQASPEKKWPEPPADDPASQTAMQHVGTAEQILDEARILQDQLIDLIRVSNPVDQPTDRPFDLDIAWKPKGMQTAPALTTFEIHQIAQTRKKLRQLLVEAKEELARLDGVVGSMGDPTWIIDRRRRMARLFDSSRRTLDRADTFLQDFQFEGESLVFLEGAEPKLLETEERLATDVEMKGFLDDTGYWTDGRVSDLEKKFIEAYEEFLEMMKEALELTEEAWVWVNWSDDELHRNLVSSGRVHHEVEPAFDMRRRPRQLLELERRMEEFWNDRVEATFNRLRPEVVEAHDYLQAVDELLSEFELLRVDMDDAMTHLERSSRNRLHPWLWADHQKLVRRDKGKFRLGAGRPAVRPRKEGEAQELPQSSESDSESETESIDLTCHCAECRGDRGLEPLRVRRRSYDLREFPRLSFNLPEDVMAYQRSQARAEHAMQVERMPLSGKEPAQIVRHFEEMADLLGIHGPVTPVKHQGMGQGDSDADGDGGDEFGDFDWAASQAGTPKDAGAAAESEDEFGDFDWAASQAGTPLPSLPVSPVSGAQSPVQLLDTPTGRPRQPRTPLEFMEQLNASFDRGGSPSAAERGHYDYPEEGVESQVQSQPDSPPRRAPSPPRMDTPRGRRVTVRPRILRYSSGGASGSVSSQPDLAEAAAATSSGETGRIGTPRAGPRAGTDMFNRMLESLEEPASDDVFGPPQETHFRPESRTPLRSVGRARGRARRLLPQRLFSPSPAQPAEGALTPQSGPSRAQAELTPRSTPAGRGRSRVESPALRLLNRRLFSPSPRTPQRAQGAAVPTPGRVTPRRGSPYIRGLPTSRGTLGSTPAGRARGRPANIEALRTRLFEDDDDDEDEYGGGRLVPQSPATPVAERMPPHVHGPRTPAAPTSPTDSSGQLLGEGPPPDPVAAAAAAEAARRRARSRRTATDFGLSSSESDDEQETCRLFYNMLHLS